MANENKDIIRVETTKALMSSVLRNGQSGYCSDTLEYAHKDSTGTMHYYTTQEELEIAASQVTYTNAVDGGITNVEQGLDFAIFHNTSGEGTVGYIPQCTTAVPLEYDDSEIFQDSSNQIGIGTTTCGAKVHIESDSSNGLFVRSDSGVIAIEAVCAASTAVKADGVVGISATGSAYAGQLNGLTWFNGKALFEEKIGFTQDTISVNASLTTYDMSDGNGKTLLFATPTANGYFLNTDGASVGDMLIVVNASNTYNMRFEIVSESTGWAVYLNPHEGASFICIDDVDTWAHLLGKIQ